MATKDISDLQVCQAYAKAQATPFPPVVWPYDILVKTTGQPLKVCFRAMERAAKRNLVDYGTSLRSGWLTDAGKTLLRERENHE